MTDTREGWQRGSAGNFLPKAYTDSLAHGCCPVGPRPIGHALNRAGSSTRFPYERKRSQSLHKKTPSVPFSSLGMIFGEFFLFMCLVWTSGTPSGCFVFNPWSRMLKYLGGINCSRFSVFWDSCVCCRYSWVSPLFLWRQGTLPQTYAQHTHHPVPGDAEKSRSWGRANWKEGKKSDEIW